MANRIAIAAISSLFIISSVGAAEYNTNSAQLQAMDKITGRVSVVEASINAEVNFGSFSIVVRDCKTRPPEEAPENFAFVDVVDTDYEGNQVNVFKGWMISSSPALNAVEHPIYDVWLLKCFNSSSKQKVLSKEQLAKRDEIPMIVKIEPKNVEPEETLILEETIIEEVPETLVEEDLSEEKKATKKIEVIAREVEEDGEGPKALFNFGEVEEFSIEEEPLEAGEEIEVEVEEGSPFLNFDETGNENQDEFQVELD